MTLTSDISSYGVPGAVTTAENWEREYEALIEELVGASLLLLSEIDSGCGVEDIIGASGPLRTALASAKRSGRTVG